MASIGHLRHRAARVSAYRNTFIRGGRDMNENSMSQPHRKARNSSAHCAWRWRRGAPGRWSGMASTDCLTFVAATGANAR